MGDVLTLSDVRVRRGTSELLAGVDWSVDDGERWVIVGPNGAGKTTLVSLLVGQIFPTTGSVEVIGERLGRVDVGELRQVVGFASSANERRLYASETVLDVVLTGAYGMSGRWREAYEDLDTGRARALLSYVGAKDLRERTFGSLSTGERKRVQIARALMPDPEVLVLDEPAAGMDLGGREELVASLARLARDPHGPVMVLVTHHLEEIPPGFTHALLMDHGAAVAAGPIDEVLTAEAISSLYRMPLTLTVDEGRYHSRRKD
ncbi:ABC transporter ATP-binding protein [Georgenia sp. Z1344]|uniref:ABC transporter ATP-binding protein n=1 Tax=Georgenia sp. Z1344 TaxID=3416706 RepID=UPI003CF2943C